MQFLYPLLTWGFFLVLVPLLIHLINLMRQKRVKWAAMEFLLKSDKKHRRWVWLKQLLLLLLRMAVVAAVVAMLAGLITNDQAAFLGGQATHHFVLVDDSISMADRGSDGRAFDQASQALRRIAEQLSKRPTDQKVTLVRFSQTTKQMGEGESAADLNAVTVDSEFTETMEEAKRRFDVTQLAIGPGAAMQFAEKLVGNAAERRRVAYLLSDFRADEWNQSAEMKEALRALRKQDCEVHLIRCTDSQHQNLSIEEVVPESGTLAAGVPLLVNVTVKNHGPSAAQQVAIRVSAKSYPADAFIAEGQEVAEDQITTLVIDDIPPGEVASRQAQLKFDSAGQHVVTASLASDALVEDNLRRCLVDVPASVPVLVVDGSVQGEESYYLQSAFAPGRVVTGITPVSRNPSYLRDVADAELARYAAIYLMNVERLDPKAVSALTRYTRAGGGLAVFVGPNSDPGFLVEMYSDGEGLFPLPVQTERENLRVGSDETPDLQVNDHPIFRVLVQEGGENRPLLRRIRIDRFLSVDPEWDAASAPETKVLATIRGTDPLVATSRFGEGNVVAFLTTLSPTWNNWATGPSCPVVLLQLHGFLSSSRRSFQVSETGVPLMMELDTRQFRPEADFVVPMAAAAGQATTDSTSIKLEPPTTSADSSVLNLSIGGNADERSGETDQSGVYVAKLVTLDGQPKQRRFVVNAPTSESDLAVVETQELSEQLEDLDIEIHSADELEYETANGDGFSWSQILAGLLIAMLLGEQLLAYSASYHPRGGNEK